ncbi:PAS domain-containing sensor histidine kinase [Halopseudomonas xiamenensis]|uniref:PAS domain-containing sensor histidine kinase n=1 Tax=Halopseudomonas xiamenensis TaxID=157792 RepID=UPI0016283597|nr:PAS domain-containing protein [Halopseudomonas xiamenensis]
MNWFWHRGRKSESSGEAVAPQLLQGSGGCWFQLDAQGRVVDASPELRRLLPDGLLIGPVPLANCLAQPVAEISGSPEYWPAQLSSLVLRARSGESLYFQGGLLPNAEGWLLCLLDNTALVMRLQYEERRRQVLDFSVSQAMRMREAPPGNMHNLTVEWLEGLALRLQAPWLGLLLPGERDWSLYAQCGLPGNEPFPWDDVDLQRLLRGAEQVKPQIWLCRTSAERAWLVPYREHDGIQVWLVVAGVDTQRQVPFFSDTDWVSMLMLFAAPLSAGVRDLRLKQSLQRHAVLQQILDSGWWEYHPATQRLSMAPSLASMLGLQLDADGTLRLEDILARLTPLDREQLKWRLEETAERGLAFNQVVCLRGNNGEEQWFRLRAEALGKRERKVIGYAININDLRQLQAETATARARLEGLLDNAPAVIFVQRYEAGVLTFEFCSASLYRLLGWTLKDLQDNSFASFIHPEDRDLYYDRTRALLQTGYASSRYRVRDRQNTWHWLLDEAKLLRDAQGSPVEVVGLLMDVTEATQASEKVRKSEERYRILVEDSPAIICRYLPDLTLTFANRPMIEALGLGEAPLEGINLGQFLQSEDRQAELRRLARMTPEAPVSNVEFCPQLPGNRRAWWVWAERGVFDEAGRLIEVQAVGRDDTEVHDARELLYQSAKMATLGEMATGLAHEMNQPLTVMRMALTNLGKRLDNDEMTIEYLREKLKRVENQVNRASRIVDHVRIFGRRSESRGVLFDPAKSVEEAVALVREGMLQKRISMEVELESVPAIKGHHDRLEQVLINLLLNAQYAVDERRNREPEHRPWIKACARERGGMVIIEVEDNGGGITPDLLDRIFEPFVTTKPVGEGTGLGLSVSYGIIHQMRGELAVKNTGQGARFSIALRARDADQPELQLEEIER